MKFSLKDFIELDTTALLAVNGGSDCSSASSSYYGTSSTSSNGQGSSVTSSEYESYKANCGGLTGTSSCGSVSTNVITKEGATVNKPSTTKGEKETLITGGYCSSIVKNDVTETVKPIENTVSYLVPYNENDSHCDIIAYNHAIDNGFDPRGITGFDWNANDYSVNQIFNNSFKGQDVDFNGTQKGKSGYLFYDFNGPDENGNIVFTHIEYAQINLDGASYNYFKNDGTCATDVYKQNVPFSEDANANARNGGNGIVRFVPLN